MAKSDSTTEKKNLTTEEMVNMLRFTVCALYYQLQKLADHPIKIDQREVRELLGFSTFEHGFILGEEFNHLDVGDISLDLDGEDGEFDHVLFELEEDEQIPPDIH